MSVQIYPSASELIGHATLLHSSITIMFDQIYPNAGGLTRHAIFIIVQYFTQYLENLTVRRSPTGVSSTTKCR